ncbi:hypothetical protein IFR05_006562 [Cadophora sp. M221]|nr:hypothetical protein IFR05_006562 [Cadophora sp. M221]
MFSSQLLCTAVLVPFLSTFTQAYNLAPLARQSLQNRATYQGGWALGVPGADCPAIAPVACSTLSGNVNPTCCPEGQLCDGSIYPYCCPTGSDCFSTVQNLPVCANQTWNMYSLSGGDQYFCCEPGQFGVLPTSGYAGICVPNDQVVASSLIATAATQAGGGGPLKTGGNTNPVPTSATKTVTSTLAGGAVTTITTEVKSTATATATGSSDAESGSGASGSDSGGSTNSGSTSKKSKSSFSTGAKVGVAIGAVAVLLLLALILWKVLGARKSKHAAAAVDGTGYGAAGGMGGAPAYTPQPQHATPVTEYKSPATVQQGSVGAGGGEWTGTPSPPPAQGQGGYMPPPMAQQPVEAPSRWERRVEM